MRNKILIDAHTHLGYWPTLKETKLNLIRSCHENHINFALFSFDGSEFDDHEAIPFKNTPLIKALDISKRFIERNEGFGMLIWIKPYYEKMAKYLDKYIAENRSIIYGLKFHPTLSHLRITSNQLKPYIKLAIKYNLPILIHTAMDEYSSVIYIKKAAKLYPNVKFIAAHMELQSDHLFTIEAMEEYKNIYCDTAWVDCSILKEIKKRGLMDRIIFGTDNPIDGRYTIDEDIYQAYFKNEMHLSRKDYDLLMYKNAIAVYNIPLSKLKR